MSACRRLRRRGYARTPVCGSVPLCMVLGFHREYKFLQTGPDLDLLAILPIDGASACMIVCMWLAYTPNASGRPETTGRALIPLKPPLTAVSINVHNY